MCHENEMGAAKEQHPYIICRLDKQRRWNSGGTVTRPLFTGADCAPLQIARRGFAGGGFAVFVGADVLDLAETKIPPIIGRDDFNL